MTRENEETPTKTFHAGIEQWKESELPSISEVVVNRLNAEDAVDVFSMALVENGFGAFREMFEDALASHYTVDQLAHALRQHLGHVKFGEKILKKKAAARSKAMSELSQVIGQSTAAKVEIIEQLEQARADAQSGDELTQLAHCRDCDLCTAALARHNTAEAALTIQQAFSSPRVEVKLGALSALGKMSIPEARRLVSKRASFLSFASREEKELAKTLVRDFEKQAETVISTSLEAARKSSSGVTTCAFCHKSVRPFAHAGGIWAGTVADLASLKIEPDNALTCSSCHSTTCPVCLGNEATKKGIRQFVCPLCGHTPVKEIYRV